MESLIAQGVSYIVANPRLDYPQLNILVRHAGEMIEELTMTAGVGLGRLGSVIHPYPTHAEAIHQVGDMFNRTRLTPTAKRRFAAGLRWSR
jgi:hypothetical protein